MSIELVELSLQNGHWLRAYLEPNNKWSLGGGRITVNISDDHVGSAFFSHVSNNSFMEFISTCSSCYLLGKIFRTKSMVDIDNGEELLESIASNHLSKIRQSLRKDVTIDDLRGVKESIEAADYFHSPSLLQYSILDESESNTIAKIFENDEWYCLNAFKKQNPDYEFQLDAIKQFQQYLKNKSTEI